MTAFRPTIEAENRLSPGPRPDQGSGFAVVNVMTSLAGSTAGVFHTVAPPVCHSLLFAHEPEAVATNTNLCIDQGVAGLSIEDNTGNSAAPLYEEKLAVERIRAACRAIDDSGIPVVLTGRCEAWLVGSTDPLRVVLERLTFYAEAGAHCLYAPGVREPNEIKQIVKAVAPKPVNVLVSGFNCELTVSQLADLGVRRISVGSGLALAAWGTFIRAAQTIQKEGSFNLLAQSAASAELNERFRGKS